MYENYKPKETIKEFMLLVKTLISSLDTISENSNREYLSNGHLIPSSTSHTLRNISQEARGLSTRLRGLDQFG